MTIGGSVRFGNVTGPLYDAGKEFRKQLPTCTVPLSITKQRLLTLIHFLEVGALPCVGMVGATLGGGVGPYGGLYGLEIDSLLSVRLVTGTGSVIDVSATSHPDLWWGIRGAGFNFGIVTSATYQVHDATNNGQAMNADLRFHASQNASIYEFARSFAGNQPDAFSIDIGIGYLQPFGGVSHLPIVPPRHRLSIPLDIYVCQSRLRWPTGRGFGAHQATARSWPISAKHHRGSLERPSDGGQIQYQPLRLRERRLARRLGPESLSDRRPNPRQRSRLHGRRLRRVPRLPGSVPGDRPVRRPSDPVYP